MTDPIHPVTLARSYCGITQTELARRIGRKQSFVARLEGGDFDFVPLTDLLVRATGLPDSFFDPARKWHGPESAVSFRKRSRCPAGIKERARFYAAIASNAVAPMIAEFVKYPPVDIPFHPAETAKSLEDARKIGASIARAVRSEWAIGWGPISDVFRLLEFKGIRLFFVREESEYLDGFACWANELPFVFLNTNMTDPARLRLDACHELGHLIMHRNIEMDARTDIIEAMAFSFGSEFLAPWETIKKEVPVIPELGRLGHLRSRWGMSMQAIVKQMHVNGAISDASYSNAFRRFSVLGYRRGPEPGWIQPDSSAIHEKFVSMVESKGIYIANLAEENAIPDSLLGAMIPLTTKLDHSDSLFQRF